MDAYVPLDRESILRAMFSGNNILSPLSPILSRLVPVPVLPVPAALFASAFPLAFILFFAVN